MSGAGPACRLRLSITLRLRMAFRGLGLSRREASWAIKALHDEALPLFAAADDRAGRLLPEIIEAPVSLSPMTAGREVVEDYRSTGLSLRNHPVRFLREHLSEQGLSTLRHAAHRAKRQPHLDRRSRSGASNAGLGQRRHVHHARR